MSTVFCSEGFVTQQCDSFTLLNCVYSRNKGCVFYITNLSYRSYRNCVCTICVSLGNKAFSTECSNITAESTASDSLDALSNRNCTLECTARNDSCVNTTLYCKCCISTFNECTATYNNILAFCSCSAVIPQTAFYSTASHCNVTAVCARVTVTIGIHCNSIGVTHTTTVDCNICVTAPRIVVDGVFSITLSRVILKSTTIYSKCTEV